MNVPAERRMPRESKKPRREVLSPTAPKAVIAGTLGTILKFADPEMVELYAEHLDERDTRDPKKTGFLL